MPIPGSCNAVVDGAYPTINEHPTINPPPPPPFNDGRCGTIKYSYSIKIRADVIKRSNPIPPYPSLPLFPEGRTALDVHDLDDVVLGRKRQELGVVAEVEGPDVSTVQSQQGELEEEYEGGLVAAERSHWLWALSINHPPTYENPETLLSRVP